MKLGTAQSLGRILESAVIVSWTDLMKDAKSGLIHLQYAFARDGSLEYLKLWSSTTRGHWRLACEYWTSASTFHGKGIHFENGFRSEGLTQTLEFVMQHQQAFSASVDFGRTGLLQIQVPTEEESTAAATSVREAFCRVSFLLRAEPAIA
jgi:hypothetical protein